MRVAQRLADGVHQWVIHDLHRQRHLRAACHLNALFQAVTETTTRFVIGFLIVNVIARQLDHANTDILGELDSFTHNLQPLRPHRVIFTAQRETTMSRKAHGRHAHAGFNNRVHQRQTLLAAPVEARQALVRFIYRHLDKIEAQRFCQLQAFQPALPGGERFFIDAKRDLFGQHIRSLAPQFGDGTFELTCSFNRRSGITDAATSDKHMNRNTFEQRQIFQRQATGDGDFEAHIGKTFDRGNVRFAPRYACGLRVTAAVINHLLNACVTPLLRLFPGPVAGQFDLHVAVKLFCYVQRAFGGVDIRTANYRHPVSVGFEAHTREDFARIGNFGVCQYDFVRVKRFQIANRTHAFAHAQNGTHFDNVDFFGNQASGFVGAIHSLVVQRDL
ncbi:hypothetical protein EC5411_16157 [Escherichia coli 541-1]|nr:hypothetical protein EC5411_16157 [Escherichia coli 541-1]